MHACIELFTFTLSSLPQPLLYLPTSLTLLSTSYLLFFYITYWVQFVLLIYSWLWGHQLIGLPGNIQPKRNTVPPLIVNSVIAKDGVSWVPPDFVVESWLACSCVGSHCCCDLVSPLTLSCARDTVSSDSPRLLALIFFLSLPVRFLKSLPFMGCYACQGNFKLSDILSHLHLWLQLGLFSI